MSTLLRQLKGESQRYTNMASYGLGKLLGSAADRITELEESVRVDHAIASDYAMALFNLYYKDIADSIPLELCSTSGGVVTQVDNMVAGVMLDMAEEISELEKERDEHMAHAYYILETCMVFSPAHFEAHNLEHSRYGRSSNTKMPC
jgi:hypothetical protein